MSEKSNWRPAVLVTGGRKNRPRNWAVAFRQILRRIDPAFVLTGGAMGVDAWADVNAREIGLNVEEDCVTDEEWAEFKGAAGPMRNTKLLQRMLDHGGGYCIVFDGGTGTADMARKAAKAGLTMIDLRTTERREPPAQRQLL